MQWRSRLAYLAMSLVVFWHSAAMVIAPAPADSALVQALRSLWQPYLLFFRLDTRWNFFAPVAKHSQFRYLIEDAAGNKHSFTPTEQAADSWPHYVWWREFKYLDDAITELPEMLGEAAGVQLCRLHADLKPRAVILLQVQEKDFWPEDELLGKRPLDPDYANVVNLRRIPCAGAMARGMTIRPVRRPQ